mgnify:CR=1 FL=1
MGGGCLGQNLYDDDPVAAELAAPLAQESDKFAWQQTACQVSIKFSSEPFFPQSAVTVCIARALRLLRVKDWLRISSEDETAHTDCH